MWDKSYFFTTSTTLKSKVVIYSNMVVGLVEIYVIYCYIKFKFNRVVTVVIVVRSAWSRRTMEFVIGVRWSLSLVFPLVSSHYAPSDDRHSSTFMVKRARMGGVYLRLI